MALNQHHSHFSSILWLHNGSNWQHGGSVLSVVHVCDKCWIFQWHSSCWISIWGNTLIVYAALIIILFILNAILIVNMIFFWCFCAKWRFCLQPTSAGVSIMAESPVSADICWSMSYRRFSLSAEYRLHKPPLSMCCRVSHSDCWVQWFGVYKVGVRLLALSYVKALQNLEMLNMSLSAVDTMESMIQWSRVQRMA